MPSYVVCALYRFVRLDDHERLRQPLFDLLQHHGVRGTLLLAREGINGTVAGTRAGIDALLAWLGKDPRLAGIDIKESFIDALPFRRTRVRLKREIVTMGQPEIDPNRVVGTYVEPADWNDLVNDPDVLLIDTRNDYEVAVGTFHNAINPDISTFREFPDYVDRHLGQCRHKKIAMFCTGGIRCEKSTAYLKEQGFDEVYHLKGGILKYLEEIDPQDSAWVGECFVFDERVTVNHRLDRGRYEQCHACRRPISTADLEDSRYEPGVSCPHCHGTSDARRLARFRERERQVRLAEARGEAHLGDDATNTARSNGVGDK